MEPLEATGGVSNYLIGSDPAKWKTAVPHYRKVRVHNVYPGIDEVFYGDNGRMEFDFVVTPGSDPAQISMDYGRAPALRVDAAGTLRVAVNNSELVLHRPVIYQQTVHGERTEIAGAFQLKTPGQVSFHLGPYDKTRELVIDPTVLYASYLGGSSNDQGNAIAVDSAGNAYIAGLTRSSDFPTVKPISSAGYGGGTSDAFITKVNPAGTSIVYSTYLGGSGSDQANAVAVDSAGNAYLTGATQSSNFPVQNPLQFNNKNTQFGGNAFVAKLNAGGLLLYATYLGGSGANGTGNGFTGGDTGTGIGVDAAGNAYIAGTTSSTDFPTKNPIQASRGLFNTVFVSKISPDGSALLYSTYYGGQETHGIGVAVDSAGNAYVLGQAFAIAGFPVMQSITTPTNGDVLVLKLTPTGTLSYSTLIAPGTPVGIAIDSSGNTYVTGSPLVSCTTNRLQ
jgi:hypothetical protein